jgi:hypothetical protein
MQKPARAKSAPKFPFVLDELADSPLAPRVRTRPMFGSHAVYIDAKIIFILRQKSDPKTIRDNGVWVASLPEHTESLRREFSALRPIEMFVTRSRTGFTGWSNLPEDHEAFEETALFLCRLLVRGDQRIGKLPGSVQRKSRR